MEFGDDYWVDLVDLSPSTRETFPEIFVETNFESDDYFEEFWGPEEALVLKRSDFFEEEKRKCVKFRKKEAFKKVEEVKWEGGGVGKVQNFDFRACQRILGAEPVEIEFHNFQLGREYKKIILIRNVSDVTIAKYQLARRFDASKLRLIWRTRSGDRVDLAPGMSTTLTLVFKAMSPEDYSEKIVINVEGGLPVVIDVLAHRDPPVFIGENYPRDSSSSPTLINAKDDLILNQSNFPRSPKRGSLTCLTSDGELECNECLVGDEKTIEVKLTNLGSSGRFFLVSEANWHSKNITDLTDTSKLITTSFTLWPAYFYVRQNQSMILRIFFTPNVDGLHVEKVFVVCDNYSLQSFELLGDGVMFRWDFIHFGPNLRRQSFCLVELEDNRFCNFFITELDPEILSVLVTVTNLSQFDINFRWDVINEICLGVSPPRGVFPGHTALTFNIFSTNYGLCSEFVESNLQLILEDLPPQAIPGEYKEFIEECRGERRRCEDSVDICVANVGVRLPSRDSSISEDTFSSEGSHREENMSIEIRLKGPREEKNLLKYGEDLAA
ncbi:deleted in lung and esophageal cancer protein 1-like [Diachasma alloeum]|uniref:deleted in lung and esophageal cancer protein 1-like n=1 Tax=Diachasma alloeum TaxID=454923 RepID=UPI0007383CAF|nr:deleted in lung and esophageal cancer protein 1-like [Diachasma alloeum]